MKWTNIHLVAGSTNKKTGPIPVATSDRSSCPTACPLMKQGCYALYGNLRHWWKRISSGKENTKVALDLLRRLPLNQLWRYAQAGDLPGRGDRISEYQLKKLVGANGGRRGFTYTHKPVLPKPGRSTPKYMLENRRLIRWANDRGFTINLSASTLEMADDMIELEIAPVVSIAPELADAWWNQWGQPPRIETPNGWPCLICPESNGYDVQCSTCGICAQSREEWFLTRSSIILFPAHGNGKKYANNIAKGITT